MKIGFGNYGSLNIPNMSKHVMTRRTQYSISSVGISVPPDGMSGPGMEPDGEARCEPDDEGRYEPEDAGPATEPDDEGPATEPDEVYPVRTG